MKQMNYRQALDMLYRAGFSLPEIDRLWRFRRNFVVREMNQASADLRHLEFIRWLVVTGRLTDQVA